MNIYMRVNHKLKPAIKFWWIFIGLLFTFIFSTASATEKITVVTEEYPPFNYTENGKLTGYSVTIAEELLKRATIEYKMDSYPWARAYKLAQNMPNVLIFTITRTPERESQFYWIGAVAQRKLFLYKLAARTDIRVRQLEDVKKYKIGVTRGDAIEDFFIKNGFESDNNLDLSPADTFNVQKLLIGRIDFIASTEFSIAYLSKLFGLGEHQIERSLLIVDEGEYFFAMSKKTPIELVKKMQLTFSEMEKDKVMVDIAKKYNVPKFK